MVYQIIKYITCHWQGQYLEAFSVSDQPYSLILHILFHSSLVFNNPSKNDKKHKKQTITDKIFGPGDSFGGNDNLISLS